MKKRLLIVITAAVLAMTLTACDFFAPYSRHDSLDPAPSYTYDGTFSYVTKYEREVMENEDAEAVTIQSYAGSQSRQYQADELVDGVIQGKKIDFASSADPTLRLAWDGQNSDGETVYTQSVLHIMKAIITEEMTDYQKVLAIHDYLSYSISYNSALYDRYINNGGHLDDYSASFNIIGVFFEHLAVCDGLSKAFMLMCAIEGIESVRVTGDVFKVVDDAKASDDVPHAWNKVKLDMDGDGTGEWYNVDTTYDRLNISINGSPKAFLIHGFFMLSDIDINEGFPAKVTDGNQVVDGFEYRDVQSVQTLLSESAAADMLDYAAPNTYDYYSNTILKDTNNYTLKKADGTDFSYSVKSKDELLTMFSRISDKNRAIGKLEVKIDYEVGDIASDIAAAYSKVNDKHFLPSNTPYVFLPNNVVFFLIYR